MKVSVIYNPNATGLDKVVLDCAYQNFKSQNMKVKLCESKYPGNVIKLVKQANKNSDLIVSLGGDGTLGEVFKAFGETKQKANYIHIPTGTANDTADNFKLYKGNPIKSIELFSNINNCDLKEVDMVTAGTVPFGYVSCCGTFTNLTYDTPEIFKKRFGKIGYYMYSGIMAFTTLPDIIHKPLKLTYQKDGGLITTEALTMIVSNSKAFAGFNIFKDANITDGLFEVNILKKLPKKDLIPILYNLFDEKNPFDTKKYPKYIDSFTTDNFKVKFETENQNVHFNHDGDHVLMPLDSDNSLEYKVSSKIKMLLPNK